MLCSATAIYSDAHHEQPGCHDTLRLSTPNLAAASRVTGACLCLSLCLCLFLGSSIPYSTAWSSYTAPTLSSGLFHSSYIQPPTYQTLAESYCNPMLSPPSVVSASSSVYQSPIAQVRKTTRFVYGPSDLILSNSCEVKYGYPLLDPKLHIYVKYFSINPYITAWIIDTIMKQFDVIWSHAPERKWEHNFEF